MGDYTVMGCDIHLFVEKRENGIWKILPPPIDTGWAEAKEEAIAPYRIEYTTDPENPAYSISGKERYLKVWFSERDYELFYALARVRGGDITPFDSPRGVPTDASLEYKLESEGDDWYGHSYFTLEELHKHLSGIIAIKLRDISSFCSLVKELEQFGKPKDIRIVFFFDN